MGEQRGARVVQAEVRLTQNKFREQTRTAEEEGGGGGAKGGKHVTKPHTGYFMHPGLPVSRTLGRLAMRSLPTNAVVLLGCESLPAWTPRHGKCLGFNLIVPCIQS
ncbi:MAG: hypothetical protein ACPIOQ_57835 [Promethearchaeia archaeon]